MHDSDANFTLAALRAKWEAETQRRNGLPAQSAFDAFELRPWLDSIVILEVHDGPKRFYYRLTGSRIDRAYGRNFTGKWLEDLRIPGSEGYWERAYSHVAGSREPLAGAVEFHDLRANQKRCDWLMLPLLPDLPARGKPNQPQLIILGCVIFSS